MHVGVVYNDVNGDGKRQVLVGGKGGEGGIPNAKISVCVSLISVADCPCSLCQCLCIWRCVHVRERLHVSRAAAFVRACTHSAPSMAQNPFSTEHMKVCVQEASYQLQPPLSTTRWLWLLNDQVLSGKGYSASCDMWSVGVVTYMLLTGKRV